MHKCVSKLLCSRLKEFLGTIVDEDQSAFVEGRQIVHNVMLLRELMNQYKRKSISPRCVIKIDLRKAYDSISWSFVKEMLDALNFLTQFTTWIMTCVRNTKYSPSINGVIHGYFDRKKGANVRGSFIASSFFYCVWNISQES